MYSRGEARSTLILVVLALLFLVRCGDGPVGEDQRPPPAPPPPNDPPPTSFSGEISPEGRTVRLRELTLIFPPNAVSEVVPISIEPIEPPAGAPGTTGTWFEFKPSGLNFDVPVLLVPDNLAFNEDMAKWVESREEDEPQSALQLLPPTTAPDGRAAAELRGFSRAGKTFEIYGGNCRRRPVPPMITSARYDPCTDQFELEWSSDAPVWIEVGYREGRRAGDPIPPVRWQSIIADRPEDGQIRLRPSAYPRPDQLAFTHVFRMYQADSCNSGTLLSPPAVVELPLPVFAPPGAPDVVARRIGPSTVEVSWQPTSTTTASFDGFEVQRRPAWPTGPKQLAANERYLIDRQAGPNLVRYEVRATRAQANCPSPASSDWSIVNVSPSQPVMGQVIRHSCERFRMSATPGLQTVFPQTSACLAAGQCPDAQIHVTLDFTDGRPVAQMFLDVRLPRMLADKNLVTIDSPFLVGPVIPGNHAVWLEDPAGAATSFESWVSIRFPSELFGPSGITLPDTYVIGLGSGDCLMRVGVNVQP